VSAADPPQHFVVVPHTHWDREWYRPFEHFRLELARVVDEILDVLERDPEFTSFTLDGQAIVLEDYLEVRPGNEGRLRALLESGRIEVGPSYVLPDEFLVGAEPLIRNLLMGIEVCRRYGAEPSPVGYLPDSFGHPLQLPQLLAGFGIETMIFSRGLGDELDEAGVVFRWAAPDGSEVLAFQLLPAYGNFAYVRDADEGERRVRAIVEQFGSALARAGVDALLLCNGEDHVQITPGVPSLCEELERRFPGSRFEIGTYADYVRLVGAADVPVHTGELLGSRLWNVLRGVNSARLYTKRANERAEQRLLATETLAALAALRSGDGFPLGDFKLAWRDLLRCHPHDTICGCSCDEVHRDAMARYESLHRTLDLLEARSVDGLEGVGVVNLLPYRRRGVIELEGHEPVSVELDGWSARAVEVVPPAHRPEPRDGTAIESDRFRVRAESDGTIAVTDKRSGRRMSGLHALEDEPDVGDLYNFCPAEGGTVWRSDGAQVRVLSDGPLVSELELRLEGDSLRVRTLVRLVEGSDRVEFRTTIDNEARDHRLRVVFPLGPAVGPVRAEGHFAVIHRELSPPPPRTQWVEPPDPTQHTLGAVALGPLALFTKGLPEYEARVVDGQAALCLTLLRCVGIISQPNGLPTRPRTAGPQLPTPQGQCLGRHECDYALRFDADSLDDLTLLRESQDYRWGFLRLPGELSFNAPLAVDGDVVFSCLKGAEDGDGLILRCFNPAPSSTTVRVAGEMSVSRTRLDETGEESLGDAEAHVGPSQIVTLRLRTRG
jgi:mannosylglycerate hydrolase